MSGPLDGLRVIEMGSLIAGPFCGQLMGDMGAEVIKIELIERAIAAGSKRIEVASFVHPGRVPQMADAEAVCAGLKARDDVTYIGLVLNKRGALRPCSLASRMISIASSAVSSAVRP